MTPSTFPEANARFGPPQNLEESQCLPIPAYVGVAEGGSADGAPIIVVGWRPTEEEIIEICQGKPIFLTCLGGLPPHFLSTDFHRATHPA